MALCRQFAGDGFDVAAGSVARAGELQDCLFMRIFDHAGLAALAFLAKAKADAPGQGPAVTAARLKTAEDALADAGALEFGEKRNCLKVQPAACVSRFGERAGG